MAKLPELNRRKDHAILQSGTDRLMSEVWDEFQNQSEDWRADFLEFVDVMQRNRTHAGFQLMAKFADVGVNCILLSMLEVERADTIEP